MKQNNYLLVFGLPKIGRKIKFAKNIEIYA
jgi:hypothetical protein